MRTNPRRRRWTARRLFAVYAVVTLVPVLLLGLLMTHLLARQADERGLSAGVGQARLVARATVAPLLDGDRTDDLAPGEYGRLSRTVKAAVDEKQVLRLRIRDLRGRIVFPTAEQSPLVDDEALEAARGETVAELTTLNGDDPAKPAGVRAVEVYLPLVSTQSGARIGVLELYLPYAPIAADVARGQRTVYVALLAGLAALWLCLIGVTASVVRHLRSETRAHEYLAGHDALTGLPNHARFNDALVSILAGDRPVLVAQLNVARFRQVSDALGRDNGDALLTALADRLREFAGAGAAVARLAGTDFALAAADVADPVAWLGELRTVIREPVAPSGVPVALDVVVGYEVVGNNITDASDSLDATTALAHAAVALSAAKRTSAGVLRYRPEQDTHDAAALALLAEMREAIANDQLVLHFQPKYDLHTGRACSAEALVRWAHPTRGLLAPGAFLDAVEATELIDDLTRWVVREACRAARSLPGQDIAVNVSARSLAREDFVAELTGILRDEDTPTGRIIVEITETAIIADPVHAARSVAELRRLGLRISIDDFGAGQTSLSHVVGMPIDELKIDRSFVSAMLTDDASAAVVRSVVALAHGLGATATAEGVESPAALAALSALGCDVAQGFHLSRPIPLDALRDLIGTGPDIDPLARTAYAPA